MTLTDTWWGDYRIGGGLQLTYRLRLGGPDHGGVTIRIASSDSFKVLLSPDATTSGAGFIEIFIPDGATDATFYVHGLKGNTGDVTLTASDMTAGVFLEETVDIELVEAVLQILNLDTSTTAGADDDPFQVRTGYVHSNGTTFRYAPVNATDAPIQVLVRSSDVLVGEVKTLAGSGDEVTVEVQANEHNSPSSVASGGVAFDPVGEGTVIISTEVTGFNNSWHESYTSVTVDP
jgi:hypothetical protein